MSELEQQHEQQNLLKEIASTIKVVGIKIFASLATIIIVGLFTQSYYSRQDMQNAIENNSTSAKDNKADIKDGKCRLGVAEYHINNLAHNVFGYYVYPQSADRGGQMIDANGHIINYK